jgi:hypothetical protein
MIHSIRWLGPLVLSTAALTAGNAAAQSSPAAPAAESRAGRLAGRARRARRREGRRLRSHAEDCVTHDEHQADRGHRQLDDLFYMRGGNKVTYRTRPHTCPNLAREDRFSYKTTMNQLCSIDLITVLEQYSAGLRDGFTCRLGPFYRSRTKRPSSCARARHAALDAAGSRRSPRAAAEERSAARRIERAGNA